MPKSILSDEDFSTLKDSLTAWVRQERKQPIILAFRREYPYIYVGFQMEPSEETGPEWTLRLRFIGNEAFEFAVFWPTLGVRGGYKSAFLPGGRTFGPATECLDLALIHYLSAKKFGKAGDRFGP